MKINKSNLLSIVAAIAIMLAGTCAHAAGFQQGVAADQGGKPLAIGIWYPSQTIAKPVSMGPTTMTVAINAPVNGKALPNYADQSRSADIMDRPRQVSRVIDHMLSTWEGHAAIDPQRVGMFGHSAGGFTTLVIIGGVPDFTKIGPMCRQHPGDFACQLLAKTESPVIVPATTAVADARIKAAVVAAPALGFTFSPDGLKNVRVPVQLWRAENDVVVPYPRYAEAVRLALPEAPDYHVVPNAGHFDFLAPCSEALASLVPAICTSSAGFDRAAFHVGFDSEVVKFFEKTLENR